MMKLSITFTCLDCGKQTTKAIPVFHDSIFGTLSSLPVSTCAYCNSQSPYSGPFVYACRNKNVLYINIASENFKNFQWHLHIVNTIINEYLESITPPEQKIIRSMERRYVEATIFSAIINGIKDLEPIIGKKSLIGMRSIRFTPTLKIKTDSEYKFMSKYINFNLMKNEIGYMDNGISPMSSEIIKLMEDKLIEDAFILSLKELNEEQHAVTTHGLTEIVLIIASTIILPIIVNCLSDAITDLRKKFFSKDSEDKNIKYTMDENDIIRLNIKIDNSNTTFYFEGNAESISKILKNFSTEVISTTTIPNVCHTEFATDNVITVQTLQSDIPSTKIIAFNESEKEFLKSFDIHSAVEIISVDDNNFETNISHKARKLMDNGDFENAYWLMSPHWKNAQTIELLFNYAYCIKELGYVVEANIIFLNVIRKYLLCMNISDLNKFDGIDTPEFKEYLTEMLLDGGMPVISDKHTEFPFQSDEELLKFIESLERRYLDDELLNISLDDLKNEAKLCKAIAEIRMQLNELNIHEDNEETKNELSELKDLENKKQNELDELLQNRIFLIEKLVNENKEQRFNNTLIMLKEKHIQNKKG